MKCQKLTTSQDSSKWMKIIKALTGAIIGEEKQLVPFLFSDYAPETSAINLAQNKHCFYSD